MASTHVAWDMSGLPFFLVHKVNSSLFSLQWDAAQGSCPAVEQKTLPEAWLPVIHPRSALWGCVHSVGDSHVLLEFDLESTVVVFFFFKQKDYICVSKHHLLLSTWFTVIKCWASIIVKLHGQELPTNGWKTYFWKRSSCKISIHIFSPGFLKPAVIFYIFSFYWHVFVYFILQDLFFLNYSWNMYGIWCSYCTCVAKLPLWSLTFED